MTEVLNHPSVRELIAELAKLEDALRGRATGETAADGSRVHALDLHRLLQREHEILGQLRRPRPGSAGSTQSTTDLMEVTS